MISRTRILATALILVAGSSLRAETPLNETRATLDKWVETRQLISKTRSDWQSDKEMLTQTTQLFERELKGVEEQIAKLGTNSTQVEKERLQAEAALKTSNETIERAKQLAAELEAKVTALTPRLPAPLLEILKPQLNRIPTNSAATRMPAPERLQVLVGILNEVDKFNNAVTIFNEKRRNEKGEEMAVETVYIGLGAAYFVNEGGNFAGAGSPGANGWDWTLRPELAPAVRTAIRIYRNEHPATFVSLPVTIK